MIIHDALGRLRPTNLRCSFKPGTETITEIGSAWSGKPTSFADRNVVSS